MSECFVFLRIVVHAKLVELHRVYRMLEDQDDPLDSEVSEDGTAHTDALTESESESETTMDSRALSYRHLSCNWDSRSKIRTSAFQKKYHTYLSMKNRHLMALAADMTGSSAAFTVRFVHSAVLCLYPLI
jgi:hypothetical protein